MTRLHPLSVPYRAVSTLTRLVWVVIVVSFSSTQVFPDLGVPVVAAVIVVATAAAVGYQVAYYRRFEYELTDDSFDIRSGVVSRTRREIPLSRVQNVDISRNVVQRALGVAEVRLETAGGAETEARLRYVDADEARRLQEDLGRLKAGTRRRATGETPAEDEDARGPEPEPEPLFAITERELVLLGLVSVDLRLVPLLSVGLPVVAPRLADSPALASPGMDLLVLAPLSAVGFYLLLALFGGVAAVTNYYGFRLWRIGDELRYERGLLQRYSGTIPLEKVQRLSVKANVLARAIGYASLAVETAGYAPGESQGSQSAVPFAKRERVYALARSVEDFGDPGFERPPERARRRYAVRYALVVAGVVALAYGVDRFTRFDLLWQAAALLFLAVPVGAHLTWRSRGYALADGYVLARSGWLVRRVHVVPDYRVQTVMVTQTVFQRRRGLATLVVDTAGTSGLTGQEAKAVDVDVDRARELREDVERRLRRALAARREQRRHERLEALGVADEDGRPSSTTAADGGSDDPADADAAGRPASADAGADGEGRGGDGAP